MMKPLWLSCFLLLMFSFWGCRVGPSYTPPVTTVPNQWKAASEPSTPVPCVDFWWEIFEDSFLNELEKTAIQNNPNLRLAIERVAEARAVAGVSRADLYPQLSANPTYSNTDSLFKIYLPPGLAASLAQLTPGNNLANLAVFRTHQFQYSLPINMSYELDLFGKLHAQYDSARMATEAEMEALCVALLTLTTDLASHYFALRTFDSQIDVIQRTKGILNEGLQLAQARFEKGLVTRLDVSEASLQVSNEEALLYDLMRQRQLQENAIAVLLGFSPVEFSIEKMSLIEPPLGVPVLLPSEVILQRPDLRQAERQAASEHALIGAAYASYFPSISLTGGLGFSSPDLKDFLMWKSRFSMIGTNIGQVLFDGGRISSNVSVAWARFKEASYNYQQLVLTALQEVEDALQNVNLQAFQAQQLDLSVKAAEETRALSIQRYQMGLVSYLEVLVNQQAALQAELSAADLLGTRYQSTIQLIKALGGKW